MLGPARAHATAMNTAPASAGSLSVAASAQRAIPSSGLPAQRRRDPGDEQTAISTSLWPAAISSRAISGLSDRQPHAPRRVGAERPGQAWHLDGQQRHAGQLEHPAQQHPGDQVVCR